MCKCPNNVYINCCIKVNFIYFFQDFFQYTEAHNFGELRTKSMPYRYFKLNGSIIEASELNATKYVD